MTATLTTSIVDKYNTLFSNPIITGIVYAQEYKPSPTIDDYNNQTIERFFVKPVNRPKIIEVSSDNYNFCTSFLYLKTNIYWKIAGSINTILANNVQQVVGVRDFNIKEIARANSVIGGIDKKLTNPLEFYRA